MADLRTYLKSQRERDREIEQLEAAIKTVSEDVASQKVEIEELNDAVAELGLIVGGGEC